jgi:hypothetical protein
MAGDITFFKECYAGLIYQGDPWTPGVCDWLTPSGSVPLLTTDQ